MLVPLNLKKASNLCLSIIKVRNGFSVAIESIVNGYGLNSTPSFMCDTHTDEEFDEIGFPIDATPCIEYDFDVIEDKDLYKCIELALKQLKDKGYY